MLSARWNIQYFITIKRRQLNCRTKRSLRNRHFNVGYQVVVFTLIHVVIGYAHVYKQISRTSSSLPYRSSARQSKRLTSVDACRNFNWVRNFFDDATFTLAGCAWRSNTLSRATATTTRLGCHHLTKHALTNSSHLARTVAFAARCWRCSSLSA